MYPVLIGSEQTMKKYADSGVKALNPKTMKWQIIDKNAKYQVRIDKTIQDEYSKTGFTNLATLLCNLDLKTTAKEQGLIM